MQNLRIETKRCYLRPMSIDDVSEKYLSWLRDEEASRYITTASKNKDMEELKQSVTPWIDDPDILFFGIFDRNTDVHIGNIKFDPVDKKLKEATLGILIGEDGWRGKGIAGEVIEACAVWFNDQKEISKLKLGVNSGNLAAVKAYKKAGFKVIRENIDGNGRKAMIMTIELGN